jgi:hypothetical protein
MGQQTFKEEEADPEGHDKPFRRERLGPKGRIGGGAESARAGTYDNQLESQLRARARRDRQLAAVCASTKVSFTLLRTSRPFSGQYALTT